MSGSLILSEAQERAIPTPPSLDARKVTAANPIVGRKYLEALQRKYKLDDRINEGPAAIVIKTIADRVMAYMAPGACMSNETHGERALVMLKEVVGKYPVAAGLATRYSQHIQKSLIQPGHSMQDIKSGDRFEDPAARYYQEGDLIQFAIRANKLERLETPERYAWESKFVKELEQKSWPERITPREARSLAQDLRVYRQMLVNKKHNLPQNIGPINELVQVINRKHSIDELSNSMEKACISIQRYAKAQGLSFVFYTD